MFKVRGRGGRVGPWGGGDKGNRVHTLNLYEGRTREGIQRRGRARRGGELAQTQIPVLKWGPNWLSTKEGKGFGRKRL